MRMRSHFLVSGLALLGGLALPASAARVDSSTSARTSFSNLGSSAGCSSNDLVGVTVTSCTGFMGGNLLKGGSGDTVSSSVAAALATLGMVEASSASYLEKIASNNGSLLVDFSMPLSGTTFLGLHLGGGSDAFTTKMRGGGTAFYRFEAGTMLDNFWLGTLLTASSGVAVFGPGPGPQTVPRPDLQRVVSVPEPQTWALLLAALAAMGLARRARRA